MAMTLRIDDELDTALTALAESQGLSKQEVVRRAVLEQYRRSDRATQLDSVADEMLDRWGDVLDRLGTV